MQHKPSHPSIDDQMQAEYLADNCDFKVKENVKTYFTEDEITEKKAIYFELSSKVSRREELAAELKDVAHNGHSPKELLVELTEIVQGSEKYGATLKELKKQSAALLKEINHGYNYDEQILFAFAFHDCNRMAYYDEHGLFVYDRPLKAGENQTTIHSLNRKTA